jgi:PKHD-type hydroxylase
MKNLWEVWTSAISEQYCDYIIEKATKHPVIDATIGFDNSNFEDHGYRSSSIRWLDVLGQDSDIAETLMRFVRRSNRNNFGFNIGTMNEIQYTEYHASSGGKYDWHHDVFWENDMPYDRKLSVVIQLSNPSDYNGAQFEFFGMPSPTPEQWSPRGSVLIFPSFFFHKVNPITSGTRISLVSWIEGPKWS